MKTNIKGAASVVLCCFTLLLVLAPAGHAATCSNSTVAGEWAFTLTGTLILPTGPVPAGAVGQYSADEEGNVVGSESRSVGGGYADETFTGKLTMNANCTGLGTLNFYESGQLVRVSVVSFVFDNHSKGVRMVQKSLTLPDGTQLPVVIAVEGRKQ